MTGDVNTGAGSEPGGVETVALEPPFTGAASGRMKGPGAVARAGGRSGAGPVLAGGDAAVAGAVLGLEKSGFARTTVGAGVGPSIIGLVGAMPTGVGTPARSAGPPSGDRPAGTILLSRISPGGGAWTGVTSSASFTRLMRSFVVGIFWRLIPGQGTRPSAVPPTHLPENQPTISPLAWRRSGNCFRQVNSACRADLPGK
jgi:hypothetical protein